MDRVKRIWYLSPMRAAKVQASLRIRAVSPEPSLLAHKSSESRGTFRQKARSLAPLNSWACAVKICHDGMLEDTNSLGAAQIFETITILSKGPIQNNLHSLQVLHIWDLGLHYLTTAWTGYDLVAVWRLIPHYIGARPITWALIAQFSWFTIV